MLDIVLPAMLVTLLGGGVVGYLLGHEQGFRGHHRLSRTATEVKFQMPRGTTHQLVSLDLETWHELHPDGRITSPDRDVLEHFMDHHLPIP